MATTTYNETTPGSVASETAFWEKDGMYMVGKVETAAVTLGQVVKLTSTAGGVVTSTSGASNNLGVAIASYRKSRTATDNSVAVGDLVTVATRGVVNVTCTGAGVGCGSYVQTDEGGLVQGLTLAAYAAAPDKCLGIALAAGTSGSAVKIKLMRG